MSDSAKRAADFMKKMGEGKATKREVDSVAVNVVGPAMEHIAKKGSGFDKFALKGALEKADALHKKSSALDSNRNKGG